MKKHLDKFGALTSAFGAFIGLCLLWTPFFLPTCIRKPIPNEYYILCLTLTFILAYLSCSCTCGRKYAIHSVGGVGGLIGTAVGWVFQLPLQFFISWVVFAYRYSIYGEGYVRFGIVFHFCGTMLIPLFTFIFSYYLCKRTKRI